MECGEDSGFTWACDCGFALCHACMANNLERTKNNGRNWACRQTVAATTASIGEQGRVP